MDAMKDLALDSFVAGMHARLHGLKGRPDLNGAAVSLLHFDAEAGRWAVRDIVSDERVKIRPSNLAPDSASMCDLEEDLLRACLLRCGLATLRPVAEVSHLLRDLALSTHRTAEWRAANEERRLDAWEAGLCKKISVQLRAAEFNRQPTGFLKAVCMTNNMLVACTDGAPGITVRKLDTFDMTCWSSETPPLGGASISCIAAIDTHVAVARCSGGVQIHALSNGQPSAKFNVPDSLAAGAPPGMYSKNPDHEHTINSMRWLSPTRLFCAGNSSTHLWSVDVTASCDKVTQLPQTLSADDHIKLGPVSGGSNLGTSLLALVKAPTQETEVNGIAGLEFYRFELISAADACGTVGATINGGAGACPWMSREFRITHGLTGWIEGAALPALTIWHIGPDSLTKLHTVRMRTVGEQCLSVAVQQRPHGGPPCVATGHKNGDVRLWSSSDACCLHTIQLAGGVNIGMADERVAGEVGLLCWQGSAISVLSTTDGLYRPVLRIWDERKLDMEAGITAFTGRDIHPALVYWNETVPESAVCLAMDAESGRVAIGDCKNNVMVVYQPRALE